MLIDSKEEEEEEKKFEDNNHNYDGIHTTLPILIQIDVIILWRNFYPTSSD